jgi:hypothetical protein
MEVKKMRDKKKRGLANRKPASPQRRLETKRQLDSKIAEIKSQQSLLLFLFVANCSEILTEPMVEMLWEFMEFLKAHGYKIINEKEIFVIPFSKLVCVADLK